MAKTARMDPVQSPLTRMAKRGVAQIMPKSNGFGKVFVQLQSARNRARQSGDLQRMGQARPIMVAFGLQKYLRFVLQPSERFTVRNPVNIPLETGADPTFLFRLFASQAVPCPDAVRSDQNFFSFFAFFSRTAHFLSPHHFQMLSPAFARILPPLSSRSAETNFSASPAGR